MPPRSDTAWPSGLLTRMIDWAQGSRGSLLWMLGALLLVTSALGLRQIAIANTDLESLAQFSRDAQTIYLPTSPAPEVAADLLRDHAPGLRWWKLAWLELNGQVDSRILHLGALALHAFAVGGLFLVLASVWPRRWLAALAVVIAGVFEVPLLAALSPAADSAWGSALVVFSLLHLWLMSHNAAGSVLWMLGLVCGVLNITAATEGLASAVALVGWTALVNARSDSAVRSYATLLANAILALGGFILAAVRASSGDIGTPFGTAPTNFLSWPFSQGAWAIVLWAPAAWCIALSFRRNAATSASLVGFSLLAMWALVQAVGLTSLHSQTPFAAADALAAGFVVNAACFAFFPGPNLFARTRNLFFFAAWAMLLLLPAVAPKAHKIEPDSPITSAFREGLITGDDTLFRQIPDLAPDEQRAGSEIIAKKELHEFLPASIRAPLLVGPLLRTTAPAFHLGGAPKLRERDGLPTFGTWSAAGGSIQGDFVSAPLATTLPILQFRIGGVLQPPATSLVLRMSDGTEIAPLTQALSSSDKWRRNNFDAPDGQFQIVARDTSATDWIAFTSPVEIGRLSRLAGKIPRFWTWLLAAGVALAGSLAIIAMKGARHAHGSGNRIASEPLAAWRVVPWIAVCVYAVFFARHVSPVAGPNDAGGYLTLAKTLLDGHVTAAPRTLQGTTAGDGDITPYLTTTFFATKDGRMSAEYTIGFPLEIWAFAQFLPLRFAVPVVIWLQLILGVLFTRLLAKAFGLPDGWAWLAGGIVGLSPLYLFQALQPQSDGPALVWVTAAVYWAWTSREKPWHAILAGLATALAVLIRPSNLLCVVPIVFCLWGKWRQISWWVLAGLPGAIFLAWYNQELFGSWYRTGYGDQQTSGFGLGFISRTLRSYALWLPEFFTPVICLGLAAPFFRSIAVHARLVLTSWVVVFATFYALWWATWDTWFNMRYVLPAMPPMLVMALLVMHRLSERYALPFFNAGTANRILPSAILLLALFGFLSARTVERRVLYWMHVNSSHAVAARWVRDHLPANAVIFAKVGTNPLWYYTDLVVIRSDHPRVRQSTAFFEEAIRAGRPVHALTYHFEERGFQWQGARRGSGYPDLPGTWERIAAPWEEDIYVWRLTSLTPPATR